jgi:pantothenate synthetase
VSNKYIWTNHALKRLKERKIPKQFIDQALQYPDKKIHNRDNSVELQKKHNGKVAAAIIKSNARGENIIVSVWVNPPFPGTKDYKKRQRYFEKKHASLLKKLWLTFLEKLGL